MHLLCHSRKPDQYTDHELISGNYYLHELIKRYSGAIATEILKSIDLSSYKGVLRYLSNT